MKDSFVIYRSVFDALMAFPSDEQKEALRMIGRYAMDDELPEDQNGMPYGLFLSVKPLIDNALKKVLNDHWQGVKVEAKHKQTKANSKQTKANQKQTISKTKHIN